MNSRSCEQNFRSLHHNNPRYNELLINFSSVLFIYFIPVPLSLSLGRNHYCLRQNMLMIADDTFQALADKLRPRDESLTSSEITANESLTNSTVEREV